MKTILKICILFILYSCISISEESNVLSQNNDMQKLNNIIVETMKQKNKLGLIAIEEKNKTGISDVNILKKTCDEIMEEIGKKKLKEAFSKIKKYTCLPEAEINLVYNATIKQLNIAQKRYGKFIGYELINEKKISSSLVKFTYIAKCTIHPLVWRFIFYKAKDKWTLNYFYWDDKIQNL